jgi:hypothetical protein
VVNRSWTHPSRTLKGIPVFSLSTQIVFVFNWLATSLATWADKVCHVSANASFLIVTNASVLIVKVAFLDIGPGILFVSLLLCFFASRLCLSNLNCLFTVLELREVMAGVVTCCDTGKALDLKLLVLGAIRVKGQPNSSEGINNCTFIL